MVKTAASISGLYRVTKCPSKPLCVNCISIRKNDLGISWTLRDTYAFISKFCTSALASRPARPVDQLSISSSLLHLSHAAVTSQNQIPSPNAITAQQIPHRRYFHDYFTTAITGHWATIRPAPYAQFSAGDGQLPLMTPSSDKTNKESQSSTIVRIPLKHAKQHVGILRSRGNRPYNEDWPQAGVLDLPLQSLIEPFQVPSSIARSLESEPFPPSATSPSSVFYYAVFDGHGGDECSTFLKSKLHEYIENAARDFYPPDALLSTIRDSAQNSADELSKQHHRRELQAKLITEWRNTVGGYFRRFKPSFCGPVTTSEPVKVHPGSVTSMGSGDDRPAPQGSGAVGSATGDASWESILTYAFLRADLDFITGKWTNTTETAMIISNGKPSSRLQSGNGTVVAAAATSKSRITNKSGSTASVALILTPPNASAPYWSPNSTCTLITAHIGDTRIILCNTITGLATPLTAAHHPSHPLESRRLRRYATAFISDSFGEERFGVLANTRSFGDASHKGLGVTAEPEVTRRELNGSEWSFMVLCSDGVSGVLSDQEIVDIIKEAQTPEEGAREVIKFAEEVVGRTNGGGDNATCMVVRLGGWQQRLSGGDGSAGTKELRKWRLQEPARRQ
ncbi:phosphatase 2C-like domain-containing protein [Kalaharituber pfeilii]|nr:phosphatase 2C-like domain-containing protein [Kalaharituber pfeilii]